LVNLVVVREALAGLVMELVLLTQQGPAVAKVDHFHLKAVNDGSADQLPWIFLVKVALVAVVALTEMAVVVVAVVATPAAALPMIGVEVIGAMLAVAAVRPLAH
jgi:hypothetical protein